MASRRIFWWFGRQLLTEESGAQDDTEKDQISWAPWSPLCLSFSWTLSCQLHQPRSKYSIATVLQVSTGVGTTHYYLKALKTPELTSWPFFIYLPGRWGGKTTLSLGSSHFWTYLMDFSDPCEWHQQGPVWYPGNPLHNFAFLTTQWPALLSNSKYAIDSEIIFQRFAGEKEFSWFVYCMVWAAFQSQYTTHTSNGCLVKHPDSDLRLQCIHAF